MREETRNIVEQDTMDKGIGQLTIYQQLLYSY